MNVFEAVCVVYGLTITLGLAAFLVSRYVGEGVQP